MKHLKIMSNDKVLFDKEIKRCGECPLFSSDGYGYGCGFLSDELETFDDIFEKCPLEDKVE